MNNKLVLSIAYEVLWFAFSFIAAYLLVLPVGKQISNALFYYILWALFFVFTYTRLIAFLSQSILLENVFVKIGLFMMNVPLFFYLMNQYYAFGRVFDEYNYTLASNIFQHIKSGTELNDLLYIKKLVTFCGAASMTVTLFMEVRIIYAIFKLRQLDKYIHKNKLEVKH